MHALRDAPYPPGCESKSSSLLDLTLAIAPFALMRSKASKTGAATAAIAGRATLHLRGVCEPTHIHLLSRGSVPLSGRLPEDEAWVH